MLSNKPPKPTVPRRESTTSRLSPTGKKKEFIPSSLKHFSFGSLITLNRMAFPSGPLSILESQNHFKGGKAQSKVSMESGLSVVGLEQGVRRRSRNGPVLNCSQAKTREKDKMKADQKKSLLGVAMRKQIGSC